MSIKSQKSSGLISAPAADFTILDNTSTGRWSISSVSLHEHAGTGDTVELFKSTDTSSASGERIDQIILAADETKLSLFDFNLDPGEKLLGNATTGALVNVEAKYTTFDGAS